MLIAEQLFSFMPTGKGGKILALYHVGLNVTCLGLFLRGLAQVQGMALSRGLDASLSGIAGIGHALLGIAMLWMLWRLYRAADGAKARTMQVFAHLCSLKSMEPPRRLPAFFVHKKTRRSPCGESAIHV